MLARRRYRGRRSGEGAKAPSMCHAPCDRVSLIEDRDLPTTAVGGRGQRMCSCRVPATTIDNPIRPRHTDTLRGSKTPSGAMRPIERGNRKVVVG